MSKKRKRKMNEQDKKTPEVTQEPRKIIGTNPDGSPIYAEEFTQTQAHTGEATPAQ